MSDRLGPTEDQALPREHELSDQMKEKLVGKYKRFKIEKRGGVLICIVAERLLELVPVSETEFLFRKTAGSLVFSQTEDGELDEAYLTVDAMGKTKVSKVREAETK